jgi:hypothetical protein
MTAAAVLNLIGREGALRVSPALAVAIRIVDVKWSYGNLRYLVAPVAGLGQEWVDAGRVVVVEEKKKADPIDYNVPAPGADAKAWRWYEPWYRQQLWDRAISRKEAL